MSNQYEKAFPLIKTRVPACDEWILRQQSQGYFSSATVSPVSPFPSPDKPYASGLCCTVLLKFTPRSFHLNNKFPPLSRVFFFFFFYDKRQKGNSPHFGRTRIGRKEENPGKKFQQPKRVQLPCQNSETKGVASHPAAAG